MIEIDISKRLLGAQGEMLLEVDLTIEEGSFVVVMGESGSGKTTLLRIVAGLERAAGDIRVQGVSWQHLAPQKREIGFVFQDYALFENMSVEQNLLYVRDDKAFAQRLLEMTELDALASRNVRGLSGGQKQRVSLCRAMMKQPKLLLMDEPLSALDEQMRQHLQEEIATLHRTFGMTTLMVSHDANASYALADRIVVLSRGKIIADGTPNEVLEAHKSVSYSLKMYNMKK